MTNGEIEQLKREVRHLQESLGRCHQFEELFARISTHLINMNSASAEAGIWRALRDFGEFLDTDRIYVFLLDQEGSQIETTHEWCADDVDHHPFEALHGVPVTSFPWSMERFRSGKTVIVNDPTALPPEAIPERTACEQFQILSYVNVPLFSAEKLCGWGGLDSVKQIREWSDQKILALRLVGEVVINALIRLREEKIREELHSLHGLLPICSLCKRIRDDDDSWHQIEEYIRARSDADFTHGICPECAESYYNLKPKLRDSAE